MSDPAPKTLLGSLAAKYAPFGVGRQIYLPDLWGFRRHDFDDIFIPLECIHLYEAVHRWARHVFGEMWSGEEIKARDLSKVCPPAYASGVERVNEDQERFSRLMVPAPAPFRALTAKGWLYFPTEAEAEQCWETEKPKLIEMFGKERAMRRTLMLAVQSLRRFLYSSHFSAAIIDPRTGAQFRIPPFFWGSDASLAAFALRDEGEHVQRPAPRIKQVPVIVGQEVEIKQGYVLVYENDFTAFLKAGDRDQGAVQTVDSAAPPTAEKAKGGRPSLYDTDALIREIVRRANLPDGLPDTRAELQRQLCEWCVGQWGREPADSTMREYLRRWVPEG